MLIVCNDFEGWLCKFDLGITKVTKDFPDLKTDECSCCNNKAEYAVVDALTGEWAAMMYCTPCLQSAVYHQGLSGDEWFAPATVDRDGEYSPEHEFSRKNTNG